MLLAALAIVPSVAEAALTAPSNLTATAVSGTAIALAWSDTNTGETGFGIERSLDGSTFTRITTTAADVTTYQSIGLSSGVRYYYRVQALGNGTRTSKYSNVASATTLDILSPSVPTGLGAVAVSCNQINLQWSGSTDTGGSGLRGYNVYVWRGAWTFLKQVLTPATSTSDTGLTGSTAYSYAVAAVDNAGNASALSASAAVTTPACQVTDTTDPSVPSGVSATVASCSQVNLSWGASTDSGGSGLKGYKVYSWLGGAWTFRKQVLVPSTSTSDTGLTASTTYYYTVAAVDNAGNESALSSWATAATPACGTTTTAFVTTTTASTTTTLSSDRTAPTTPASITGSAASCSQVNLAWTASTDSGGSGLKGYNVYSWLSGAWTFRKQVLAPSTSTSDTGLAGSTTYYYAVAAVDNAGNTSVLSPWVTIVTPACGTTSTTISSTTSTTSSSPTSTSSSTSSSTSTSTTIPSGSGGQAQWVDGLGSAWEDGANAVVRDGSGNLLVTGTFTGSVDFGGGALTSNGNVDGFVAKYSASGLHLWSRSFGGIGSGDSGNGIAVDTSGNVYVVGSFAGTANLGGGAMTSAGVEDIFLVKYSPTGAHLWSRRIGSTSSDAARAVAIDASGNVLVTGNFQGTVDFGGGALSVSGTGAFVAKYTTSGTHVWSRAAGGSAVGRGIAVDGSGNVVAVGNFGGGADFGGGGATRGIPDLRREVLADRRASVVEGAGRFGQRHRRRGRYR